MTNVFAIVAQQVDFRTSTNADWLDGVRFVVAGAAAGYPAQANIGNGAVAVSAIGPGAKVGAYDLRIVQVDGTATTFALTDPDGIPIAVSIVGAATVGGSLAFTVSQGSVPFVAGDSLTMAVMPVPLDLTGCGFDMMLRRSTDSATVALSASTGATPTPTIINGGPAGTVALRVMRETLRLLPPDTYAYDLIASGDGYRTVAAYGTVTHVRGQTSPIF